MVVKPVVLKRVAPKKASAKKAVSKKKAPAKKVVIKKASLKRGTKKAPAKKPLAKKGPPRAKAPKPVLQRRSRVGVSLDHSGSMQSLARGAMADFNQSMDTVRAAALNEGIETRVSVVRCGVGRGDVEVAEVSTPLSILQPLRTYPATGMTPLYDSVLTLIDLLKRSPEAEDPETTFLIMVITDGLENASMKGAGRKLAEEIRKLQATDKWSFVFRVPPRYGQDLVNALGIFPGNIQEWEISQKGLELGGYVTSQSLGAYYGGLSRGVTSTKSFYQTDTSKLTPKVLEANLVDISNEVEIWFVKNDREGGKIRDFCLKQLKGSPFRKGCAFYLLEKKTVLIQEYKMLCIRDKDTGVIYSGNAARSMLGIPPGRYSLKPSDHGKWEIYVQSTSVNRKLFTGDRVLYWPGAAR